jgi:pSer/pThr/pTyr-binding forkhead associated (FHA) protein
VPGQRDPDFDSEATVAGEVSLVESARSGGREPVLEQVKGPGAPRQYRLVLTETIVGRGQQATVLIDSALLSRRHVAFRRSGPAVTLEDLDSQNGVHVNGVKVHCAVLHEGDTLQLGDVVFVFHEALA